MCAHCIFAVQLCYIDSINKKDMLIKANPALITNTACVAEFTLCFTKSLVLVGMFMLFKDEFSVLPF